MVTTNPVINELRTLLSQKKAEIHAIRQEYEVRLKRVEADTEAIERTLAIYLQDKPTADEPKVVLRISDLSMSHLRRLRTQMNGLDYIAERNDGYIKVNVAKGLLIEAGLTKGQPKYVYGHIYNMLKDSDRYEKSGEGEFRRKQHILSLDENPNGSHAEAVEPAPRNYVAEVANGYQGNEPSAGDRTS